MTIVDEDDDDPAPGVKRWLVSCDESGVHGARHYGFGSLWMPWQRRGDFFELIRKVRFEHGYEHEIKWNSVKARFAEAYDDLVELFFKTSWLAFHCLVVEKAVVRKELHDGDWDEARRKHLEMFLTNKIQTCIKAHPGRELTFRIELDPIASRYDRADEALQVICNNVLAKTRGRRAVDSVHTRDSREAVGIQLCDLLLGGVIAAWEGDTNAEAKLDLQQWIAYHLGWRDLRADTRPDERKFNVWVFFDGSRGARKVTTPDVSLVHPLPPPRVRYRPASRYRGDR